MVVVSPTACRGIAHAKSWYRPHTVVVSHTTRRTRGKTPGTSKPLIELIFSNITTSPTRGCEEVLHRIAQRPIAIYSGAKVINPNIFLRLLLNFQLAIRNRQTISIRGAE